VLPIWAGIVPIHAQLAEPVSDGRVLPDVKTVDRARFAHRTDKDALLR